MGYCLTELVLNTRRNANVIEVAHVKRDLITLFPEENAQISSMQHPEELEGWLERQRQRPKGPEMKEWFKENWLNVLGIGIGTVLVGRYAIALDPGEVWRGLIDLGSVCLQFGKKYLFEPVMEIWMTIRHSQATLTIGSANTLRADLEVGRIVINNLLISGMLLVSRANGH